MDHKKKSNIKLHCKFQISEFIFSDGRHNYPGYNIRYKDANFNNVKHLNTPGVDIGTVRWSNSLR
jgi:hypothetical protein